MDEYTFENLIINPETPGLDDLIGKEVYFDDVPIHCIKWANEDYEVGILADVRKDNPAPFLVKTSSGCMLNYPCIVPKRDKYPCIIEKKEEPEPEFVPFASAGEFLDEFDEANYSITNGTLENRVLLCGGIWLKSKKDDSLCMVAGVRDDGLAICDKKMTISGIVEYNVKMSWDEILADFVFLDGTPCGMNSLRRTEDE